MDKLFLSSLLLLLALLPALHGAVSDRRATGEDVRYDYGDVVLPERNEDDANCSNRHSVPSYFWDWLLFPVAIDDLVTKLEDLSDKLGAINSKLSSVDFDQIPAGSGLNFGQILQANYEWLAAEDPTSGGALVPFNRLLDVMETKLEAAIN